MRRRSKPSPCLSGGLIKDLAGVRHSFDRQSGPLIGQIIERCALLSSNLTEKSAEFERANQWLGGVGGFSSEKFNKLFNQTQKKAPTECNSTSGPGYETLREEWTFHRVYAGERKQIKNGRKNYSYLSSSRFTRLALPRVSHLFLQIFTDPAD